MNIKNMIVPIVSIVTILVVFTWAITIVVISEGDRKDFCMSQGFEYELEPANPTCVNTSNKEFKESYSIIEIEDNLYLEEKLVSCYNDANVGKSVAGGGA